MRKAIQIDYAYNVMLAFNLTPITCTYFSTLSTLLISQEREKFQFISLFYYRYQKPLSYDDEDLENSYFRRKPTSFLSSNDPKRHTWITSTSDDDSVRMEGPRPMRNLLDNNGGLYVVGTNPQKSSFLSQSTEQITG